LVLYFGLVPYEILVTKGQFQGRGESAKLERLKMIWKGHLSTMPATEERFRNKVTNEQ
jgi:hypothetical protein